MPQVKHNPQLVDQDELTKLSFGKSLFTFIFVGPVWLLFLRVSLSEVLASQTLLLQTLLILISAFMFTLEFSKARPSPVVLVIWIFNCGIVGVPGLSQLLIGVYPWPLIVDEKSIFQAQVCTLIASLFLILLLEAPHNQKNRDRVSRNLDRIRVRNLTILMLPATLYAIRAGGGITAFFSSRTAISSAKAAAGLTTAQSGLFVTGTRALVLFICVSAIILRKKDKHDTIANFSLVTSTLGLIVLANPLSSSRFWFFTVVAALVITTVNLNPARVRLGAMSLFYGSMFIFPLADYFRSTNRTFGSVGTSAWSTGDFDALQITSAGIAWFQENGAVWGHQLTGALLPFIPRSIWTSKPIDTGIMIARANGMKFENISGPWIAEAVINFGYLGLIIFPFLIAYLFRIIKFRAELFPDDFGVILNGFLVGYLPILLRGSLLQASGAAGIFALYVWYSTPKVTEQKDSGPRVPANTSALSPLKNAA